MTRPHWYQFPDAKPKPSTVKRLPVTNAGNRVNVRGLAWCTSYEMAAQVAEMCKGITESDRAPRSNAATSVRVRSDKPKPIRKPRELKRSYARVDAAQHARASGWKRGDMVSSKQWVTPRRVDDIVHDGVWFIIVEKHRSAPLIARTVPDDAAVVKPGERNA